MVSGTSGRPLRGGAILRPSMTRPSSISSATIADTVAGRSDSVGARELRVWEVAGVLFADGEEDSGFCQIRASGQALGKDVVD